MEDQSGNNLRTPSGTRSQRTTGASKTPVAYKFCDNASGFLILLSVVFAPWAFGTTKAPETWILNSISYLLGILLFAKWMIRWQEDYTPPRWIAMETGLRTKCAYYATRILVFSTILILLYCVLAALNARAAMNPSRSSFVYNSHYIPWLPHSYDHPATWAYFAHYLGFACFFWALRDWLLGKSSRERRYFLANAPGSTSPEVRSKIKASSEEGSHVPGELPDRMRQLLWVLCISASILAFVSILQRLSGTGKLLWLVEPRWNKTEESQFGPYAYRSNAAQYFNLCWPICLAFWSLLRRENLLRIGSQSRVGGSAHVVLLPLAVFLMAAPIISTSRGGALVALAGIPSAIAILFYTYKKGGIVLRVGILLWFMTVMGFAATLGWDRLQNRLRILVDDDSVSGRSEIYSNSRDILKDHRIFGVGPGAFSAVYKFYRKPGQVWHAWVHDDWLEFLVCFGWLGFSFILLALACTCSRWFASDGIWVPWEFTALLFVAIGGCLAHAKFDFPLQIHSIAHMFLIVCVLLFVTRRHGVPR